MNLFVYRRGNLKYNQKLSVVSCQQHVVLLFWVTNVPDLCSV